ncbi:DEAD/DEAH box helicase [Hymenobacter arizonensis]|uniref:Superfamily II DNA or RNA helicase n=1 Tax=Hymenobacter arizonensis TaxID=1227077 RepID=A0A1I6BFK2_HYMAR|nr:DEAD/DEAH box helicase family protein [Hymenobacter arizonensis]SFQ79730.1 Superfamily II DNA or RNA helicase [Hymenobacter arizonensis]
MSASPVSASLTAQEKKQALQDHVLTVINGRQLAGAAVAMGVGKTLIGLRDMARLLSDRQRLDPATKPFLVAAPTGTVLDSWHQEARKFGLAHLLDAITFTTYRSLSKTLMQGHYSKLYLDECHALKDSHEPGLRAHVARKKSILGLTGTPPAQPGSEKGRLVATYCPIVIDYTTDEAVLAGLLNDYRLVVHRLPLSPVRDHRVSLRSGQQFTTSERESYQYWSGRLANAAQDALPVETLRLLRMQALMHYPGKGRYMAHLARQFAEKVLLFTCNQQQAEEQAEHTYHSKNKNSPANLAKFNTGEIQRLACVAQLSEGINIPNLRVGIIWHAYGNERKAAQRIGRLLRLNPEQTATVHLLMYQDTVDEYWVAQALAAFDPAKISYVDARLEQLDH